MPYRVQRKRTKDWRKPENTVNVTRPGKWGNPYHLSYYSHFADPNLAAVGAFTEWITRPEQVELIQQAREELRGKNLMCWCRLSKPCHADVWLEIANRAPQPDAR